MIYQKYAQGWGIAEGGIFSECPARLLKLNRITTSHAGTKVDKRINLAAYYYQSRLRHDIVIASTKGGKRHTETFKKFELITTHTARRSFATNAYLQNVPTISIMKITGHRTEKSFLKYIKISQEDNANKLVGHPFFK